MKMMLSSENQIFFFLDGNHIKNVFKKIHAESNENGSPPGQPSILSLNHRPEMID